MLLLYIMFEIIDELIKFIKLLISIIGDSIATIAKKTYINTNPFSSPYKNPPAVLKCLIIGNFAIKSPENLNNNNIILEIINTIIIVPILIIVLDIFCETTLIDAFFIFE